MKLFAFNIVLIFILFCSCSKNEKTVLDFDENGLPIITNQYKLNFIKEFLNDSSFTRHKWYSDPYIFMIDDDNKTYTVYSKPELKHLKKIEFLSLHLKTQDTSFVVHQIHEDLINDNLISYGLKSINWDNLIDYHFDDSDLEIEYFVSEDSIAKVEESLKERGILYLSTPIFNEKLNLAFMETEHGVTGESIIFERIKEEWKVKFVTNEWIR